MGKQTRNTRIKSFMLSHDLAEFISAKSGETGQSQSEIARYLFERGITFYTVSTATLAALAVYTAENGLLMDDAINKLMQDYERGIKAGKQIAELEAAQ